MSEERIEHSQWLKRGNATFIPTDNAKTVKCVDPGVYSLRYNNQNGFYLVKKTLHLDELLILPSKAETEVLEGITSFWDSKDKFKEYGFIYKRGILLYGPPGTGKTSLINIIIDRMIKEHNGVIFTLQYMDDLQLYGKYIPEIFRSIEPGRPILTVIEDIDCFCTGGSLETELINILDGIEQLDNVVYIATTNYTEKLPERILNRPNRFDRRIKIGYPTQEVREAYLRKKLKSKDLEDLEKSRYSLKTWVTETKNMTLSHIGELIKSVIILGNNFPESVKMLRDLKNLPISSQYNKSEEEPSSIGFIKITENEPITEELLNETIKKVRKSKHKSSIEKIQDSIFLPINRKNDKTKNR